MRINSHRQIFAEATPLCAHDEFTGNEIRKPSASGIMRKVMEGAKNGR